MKQKPVWLRRCRASFDQLGLVCARTSLGLWSPARTRDRQQVKEHGPTKEAQVGNGETTRSAHLIRIYVESSECPKYQRQDRANYTQPITYCWKLFFHVVPHSFKCCCSYSVRIDRYATLGSLGSQARCLAVEPGSHRSVESDQKFHPWGPFDRTYCVGLLMRRRTDPRSDRFHWGDALHLPPMLREDPAPEKYRIPASISPAACEIAVGHTRLAVHPWVRYHSSLRFRFEFGRGTSKSRNKNGISFWVRRGM